MGARRAAFVDRVAAPAEISGGPRARRATGAIVAPPGANTGDPRLAVRTRNRNTAFTKVYRPRWHTRLSSRSTFQFRSPRGVTMRAPFALLAARVERVAYPMCAVETGVLYE